MKDIGLIALDMDGTLLLSDHHTLPQRNIDAILRAHEAGVRVCICTGRMIEDASDFARRFGLPCLLITGNGTRASEGPVPENPIILRKNLNVQDAHGVLDLLVPTGLMINGFEDGFVNTIRTDPAEEYHLVKRGLIGVRYGEPAMREAVGRGLMKFYIVGKNAQDPRLEEARRAIGERFPHLQLTSSEPDNIEVMSPESGKGEALQALAERFGLTRENVMAVGDAQNDLSMLNYAGHSVAMGNAEDCVKRACRYVTGRNDECGVAQIMERVVAAKRS